jgi:hypothetical protein
LKRRESIMSRYLLIGVIILGVLACQITGATQQSPIAPSAVVEEVVQVDTTRAVETGIAAALTASAEAAPPTEIPPPTDTQTPEPPPTEVPTKTPTEPPQLTPTSRSLIWPTATKAAPTPTAGACFVVLDSWCLSHEGCATMTVLNKTTDIAKLYFSRDSWSANYTAAPGGATASRCTIMLQPGRYYYKFTYCGKTNDGYHALNDNWYIQFKCP